MTDRNPYAPPQSDVTDVKNTHCTRDGKRVIIPTGSDLPARCIVCNAPALQPVARKKLYWHSPWLYLLIVINIILYAIVALVARKTFEVSPGLCGEHTSARRRRMGMLAGTGLAGLVLGGVLLTYQQGGVALLVFCAAVLLLVIALLAGRKVYPTKITKEYAQLAGCKEPFLASLGVQHDN